MPEEGELWLFAWGAEDAAGTRLDYAPTVLRVPDDVSEVVLRMGPGVGISGTVVQGDGAPQDATILWLRPVIPWVEGFPSEVHAKTVVGATGTFRVVGLAAVDYEIHVRPPAGWLAPKEPLRVRPPTDDVLVVLERSVGARIRVVDPDGAPFEGAIVEVGEWRRIPDPDAPGEDDPRVDLVRLARAETDAEGVAAVAGLREGGTYRLVASPPPGRRDLVAARAMAEWLADAFETLALRRAVPIRGRAILADGRTPLSGFQILAQTENGNLGWVIEEQCDEQGRFDFDGFAADDAVQVVVFLPEPRGLWDGMESGYRIVDVPSDKGRDAVDVVVDLGGHLTVDVTPEGGFRSGVRVEVHPMKDFEIPGKVRRRGSATRMIEPGRITFWGLPRDELVRVVVGPTSDGLVWYREGVRADGSVLDAKLEPGPGLAGRVSMRGEGNPAAGSKVWARRDGWPEVQAAILSDGTLRFPGLPRGVWLIGTDPPRSGRRPVPTSAEAGDTDVEVE